MDLAKFLSSLGSGIFLCVWRSHGCLSDLGVVMVVMVLVMVLGKKEDASTGRLTLWLQEEDFWVVQLSWLRNERRW